MENHIDQLFKEKLEKHAQPAPTEAWSKIEAALPKKNKIIVWWRLAAVFLLFGMLVSALYWLQSNDKEVMQPVLAEKKKDLPQAVKKKDLPINKSEVVQEKKSIVKSSKSNQIARKAEIRKAQTREDKIIKGTQVFPEKTQVITAFILHPVHEKVIDSNVEKPIVLEFTLEPIEEQVVAQIEERNTGLKKVWAKAKDIKNGEGGIDLADFTSKLFAANHKQNKNNIN